MPLKFTTIQTTTENGETTGPSIISTPIQPQTYNPSSISDGSGQMSLSFTDGATYDLDKIIFDIRRDNSEAPLLVKVNSSEREDILKQALEEILVEYSPNIELQATIEEGSDEIAVTEDILEYLLVGLIVKKISGTGAFGEEARISEIDGENLKVTLTSENEEDGDVVFKFMLDNTSYIPNFLALLEQKYNDKLEYIEEQDRMNDVEGSLRINEAQKKIGVSKQDIMQYLFEDKPVVRSKPLINLNRPVVIWTELGNGDLNTDEWKDIPFSISGNSGPTDPSIVIVGGYFLNTDEVPTLKKGIAGEDENFWQVIEPESKQYFFSINENKLYNFDADFDDLYNYINELEEKIKELEE
jgi:hypothetical protein